MKKRDRGRENERKKIRSRGEREVISHRRLHSASRKARNASMRIRRLCSDCAVATDGENELSMSIETTAFFIKLRILAASLCAGSYPFAPRVMGRFTGPFTCLYIFLCLSFAFLILIHFSILFRFRCSL